jgi:hypothetical protein
METDISILRKSGHFYFALTRISQSRAGSSDINNVSNIGQAYHQSKCGKQLLTLIG